MDVVVNPEQFLRHPVRSVVGLLPTQDDAQAACDDLERDAVGVRDAHLLVGPAGVRILDIDGTEHGYLARVSRVLTHVGSEENVLHLHNDGLVGGEVLLSLGCDRDVAPAVTAVLTRHGGHAVAYFGHRTLEAMSPP